MQTALQEFEEFDKAEWELDDLALGCQPFIEPIAPVNGKPVARQGYQRIKRAMDIVSAGALLLLLALPMLVIALAIRLESKGPVFFSQTRCGEKGRHFKFWKFRSMVSNAEGKKTALENQADKTSGIRFKMTVDPRVTKVGRFIRKYSIDELPQLWNVLKGDMSMVGPRPPLPEEVAEYSRYEFNRLSATPGITCTWQIGGRSDIPFDQQVEMDLDYIAAQSLMLDLTILVRTPLAVLAARGAY